MWYGNLLNIALPSQVAKENAQVGDVKYIRSQSEGRGKIMSEYDDAGYIKRNIEVRAESASRIQEKDTNSHRTNRRVDSIIIPDAVVDCSRDYDLIQPSSEAEETNHLHLSASQTR